MLPAMCSSYKIQIDLHGVIVRAFHLGSYCMLFGHLTATILPYALLVVF